MRQLEYVNSTKWLLRYRNNCGGQPYGGPVNRSVVTRTVQQPLL